MRASAATQHFLWSTLLIKKFRFSLSGVSVQAPALASYCFPRSPLPQQLLCPRSSPRCPFQVASLVALWFRTGPSLMDWAAGRQNEFPCPPPPPVESPNFLFCLDGVGPCGVRGPLLCFRFLKPKQGGSTPPILQEGRQLFHTGGVEAEGLYSTILCRNPLQT